MPREGRMAFVTGAVRAGLAGSRALVATGLTGVALGAVCLGAALVRGPEVPPEGNLMDTATFDGALGVFVLTLALLVPGVAWTPRGRRRWTRWLVGLTAYAYTIETVQAFRGLDPRFSRVATPLDSAAGGVFFLTALGVLVCASVVAVKYFRASPTPLVVAIRYGAAASWIAFGVGIWMSLVVQGRFVPEAGNLLVVHAAGFHGLQAIPLVALLSGWAREAPHTTRRRVHVAGIAWAAACVMLAWQSGTGRAVAELSPAMALAGLSLALVAVVGLSALAAWFAE